MDMDSDMGVGVGKPENLTWIEQVILGSLDSAQDPNEMPSEVKEEQSPMEQILPSSEQGNISTTSTRAKKDTKLMIAEIEMRDENYFGNDRMNTMSRLVSARIKYLVEGDDDERSHFWIMKIPSILPQERELARVFDVYRREICFYTEILPAMKLWVDSQYIDNLVEFKTPSCFYGKFARENDKVIDMQLLDHILKAESLLVLEDLRVVDYGKKYFGQGMVVSEVFAAVAEICKFHAVSYSMQTKANEYLNWKELLHWKDFATNYERLFHRGFDLFKNFLSNRDDEPESDQILKAMTHLSSKILHVLNSLVCPSKVFPTTLVHMDFWSDNLLFRVKGEDMDGTVLEEADLDCMIIDWQMVSLGRPTHDLGLLTILSMESEDRREIGHYILQYYYQIFERTVGWFGLDLPFTYETLIAEYSNSCLLAVIMAVSSMDIVLMEESTQTRLLDAIKDLIEDRILTFE